MSIRKSRLFFGAMLVLAIALLLFLIIIHVGGNQQKHGKDEEVSSTHLIWYQVGDSQEDLPLVLEKVNEYTKEKIGVSVEIRQITWDDYTKKLQVIINAGESFDIAFASSWTGDYLINCQKGNFIPLDELIAKHGDEMYQDIDPMFWMASKVGGKIYGIPSQKEIGSMQMWVFTKEYVDKYQIPYQTLHTLEDLEPWLKLIREQEPDVVPLYLTSGFSVPKYMDQIQEPLGIEYDDESLMVKNIFETSKMSTTLDTMRRYYVSGYINSDAAIATDDNHVKRLVTKGDGQPYAEIIWSRNLGYEVVTSPIMETRITNASARGALNVVSRTSKNPEKAVEFLNLVNTDEYLRNLLNYGMEGLHYHKLPLSQAEEQIASKNEGSFTFKIKLDTKASKRYSVPYWVQGGLFNTYLTELEPIDKWNTFEEYNKLSQPALTFGFDFNIESVINEISNMQNVLEEFSLPLFTGSVDPKIYLPMLNKKLEEAGMSKVLEEMQHQIDEWKEKNEEVNEGKHEG